MSLYILFIRHYYEKVFVMLLGSDNMLTSSFLGLSWLEIGYWIERHVGLNTHECVCLIVFPKK